MLTGTFESAHWTQPSLQPTMISFYAVVGVLLGHVQCERDDFLERGTGSVASSLTGQASGVEEAPVTWPVRAR